MGEYAPLMACTFVALAAGVYWLMDRRQKSIRKRAAAAAALHIKPRSFHRR